MKTSRSAKVGDEYEEDDLGRSDEVIDLDEVSARAKSHDNNSQKQQQPKQRASDLDSSDDEGGFNQAIQLNIASKQGVREALEF